MLVSDVLRVKGHNVVKIHATCTWDMCCAECGAPAPAAGVWAWPGWSPGRSSTLASGHGVCRCWGPRRGSRRPPMHAAPGELMAPQALPGLRCGVGMAKLVGMIAGTSWLRC